MKAKIRIFFVKLFASIAVPLIFLCYCLYLHYSTTLFGFRISSSKWIITAVAVIIAGTEVYLCARAFIEDYLFDAMMFLSQAAACVIACRLVFKLFSPHHGGLWWTISGLAAFFAFVMTASTAVINERKRGRYIVDEYGYVEIHDLKKVS